MKRFLWQLLIGATLGLLIVAPFSSPLLAAGNEWVFATMDKINNVLEDPNIEMESHVIASGTYSKAGMVCDIIGCGYNDPRRSAERGLFAGMNNAIIAMYSNPPANTMAFVQDLSQTLGFSTKPAYAQGIGFSGLAVMLPIWKAFRDIAYGLIAIVMVVVGFMVMLRKKIDPKTVVTVQNAIPRIIMTLILVTFSYAIVGLLIDLMYFVLYAVISLIVSNAGHLVPNVLNNQTATTYLEGNLWTTLKNFFAAGTAPWDNIATMIPWEISGGAAASIGIISFIASGLSLKAAVLGTLAIPVAYLALLALILLFGMVRLLFMLIDAYINIIISLLTAPLQLAMGAVPGVDTFGPWIRNLISKLVVFPITAVFILITWILTDSNIQGTLWAPPLLAPSGAPGSGMAGIIGLGMLLGIPSIVANIQKTLKAEPPVAGGVATIAGPLGTAAGQLFQLGYQFSFITSQFRHGKEPKSAYGQAIGAGSQGLGGLARGGGGGGGAQH